MKDYLDLLSYIRTQSEDEFQAVAVDTWHHLGKMGRHDEAKVVSDMICEVPGKLRLVK